MRKKAFAGRLSQLTAMHHCHLDWAYNQHICASVSLFLELFICKGKTHMKSSGTIPLGWCPRLVPKRKMHQVIASISPCSLGTKITDSSGSRSMAMNCALTIRVKANPSPLPLLLVRYIVTED